jgi:hypothetical protein
VLTTLAALGATVVVVVVLAGRRHEFVVALHSAAVWLLLLTAALQLVALCARCEAWHGCVCAAGGSVRRRRLYCAASVGSLASQGNPQLGAAARIAVLRRMAPEDAPRVPALIAAEVPILAVEAVLAALTSFTLVGPLGLPWWSPVALIGTALLVAAALSGLAGRLRHGLWSGLGALRSARASVHVVAFVLVAVLCQVARNWLMLRAVGVHASVFDAIAVLIAMVTLAQLPIGPTVGAAAVVAVLGAHGLALAAAAGVLLTATGTAGAVMFAAGTGIDRLARRERPAPAPRHARRRFTPAPNRTAHRPSHAGHRLPTGLRTSIPQGASGEHSP